MRSSPFFYFLTLEFFKERKKHIGVISISLVILFLLSSVLFISSSIRHSLAKTIAWEPDFVVQRVQGGARVDLPAAWIDEIISIHGIEEVTPRVYGRYFFKSKENSALIIGVDFRDEQSHRALRKMMDDTDLKQVLQGDKMLVGEGVSNYLKAHFYPRDYTFLTPKGEFKTVEIFKILPSGGNLLSNDMIIMPIALAQEVLGLNEEEVSDIAFNVPNDDEWANAADKVSALHYDLRVINKEDIEKAYENLYNYKGGIFLILFLITMVTFMLILYQRYAMVYSSERRHIGLLRALGWSIHDVLKLKFFETMMVVVVSFVLGVTLAYFYVFVLGAPLLREIFLGGANLHNKVTLVPVLDFTVLSTIFLIYAVPFVSAVLIPVWKIAVTDPKEAML
ncbi:MAG TPA: FtsX-like permease family protein [Epsilonproteobacteria bacterium]|nr:FtsX-like permease family protein [Campylobacterota bacterium]